MGTQEFPIMSSVSLHDELYRDLSRIGARADPWLAARLCLWYTGTMERIFLGLGSNLGERIANIKRAFTLLGAVSGLRLVRASSLIETAPVGYTDQPDFINAVVEIETSMEPGILLSAIQGIEKQMGREKTIRFGPRIIDIDILLFGDRVIDGPGLTIPHPRMHERAFVLGPLSEIAPEVMHPVLKQRIADILARLLAE